MALIETPARTDIAVDTFTGRTLGVVTAVNRQGARGGYAMVLHRNGRTFARCLSHVDLKAACCAY